MNAKDARTPKERASVVGKPMRRDAILIGPYAREVTGEEKALCHVSDQNP